MPTLPLSRTTPPTTLTKPLFPHSGINPHPPIALSTATMALLFFPAAAVPPPAGLLLPPAKLVTPIRIAIQLMSLSSCRQWEVGMDSPRATRPTRTPEAFEGLSRTRIQAEGVVSN